MSPGFESLGFSLWYAPPKNLVTNCAYISDSIVDSPVGLLLTDCAERRNAMTVSFFSEVAHHPTTLWVSIATASYTHGLLRESGQFSLIVLHQKQKDVALMCGTVSGREQNKFSKLALYRQTSAWMMADALASIACRVRSSHSLGDHELFVADILFGELNTRKNVLRHLLVRDLR